MFKKQETSIIITWIMSSSPDFCLSVDSIGAGGAGTKGIVKNWKEMGGRERKAGRKHGKRKVVEETGKKTKKYLEKMKLKLEEVREMEESHGVRGDLE